MPFPRLRLTVTLTATIIAGCAGAPASAPTTALSPTPTVEPSTSAWSSPAELPPSSLAPLPAPGALADVALRFTACDIDCHQNPGLTVLKDGRVIRSGAGGMTQRPLSTEGMRLLRDEVVGTGLFARDATFEPVLEPGRQPAGFGPMGYRFEVGFGEASVEVGAAGLGPFEANNAQDPGVWAVPPEAYVLEELASKLEALESWLPAEAWDGAAIPYAADRYLLIVTTEREQRELPSWPDVDRVDWPFTQSIELVGERYDRQDISDGDSRCMVVSSRELEAMAIAEGAGPEGRFRDIHLAYQSLGYTLKRDHGTVDVTTRMVLPYQRPTCEGAGNW